MSWKAPQIVEMPVGMEINMYACAKRGLASSAITQPCEQRVIA
jgi:coenzyme PQQ precursor peptide PqqA